MKWILIAALLCGCATQSATVSPPAGPGINPDHVISMAFNQSFADNPPCSTTVTSSCISGYLEGYISATGVDTQLHTDTIAICNATSGACTTTFNGIIPLGSLNFYIVQQYIDQNSRAQVSPALNTASPTQVNTDPATGLTVTVQ